MNFLTKKKEKEIYVHLSGFMHPSKQALYCQVQEFQDHEFFRISFSKPSVNVIDGMPFELLECHSAKQLFLAAGFYS